MQQGRAVRRDDQPVVLGIKTLTAVRSKPRKMFKTDARRELQQIHASSAGDRDGTRNGEVAVAEAPKMKPTVRGAQKIGRNDPCPCGSGKKYKHCHGKLT
jgi:preprotein translocase subunit SecA